ncbi:MAG: hypothetical protein JWM80_734 [Cyanobacteria bacterium RYN_339]|nr:hypothetical protein [Cyanobacteria bacterium RYN_339]
MQTESPPLHWPSTVVLVLAALGLAIPTVYYGLASDDELAILVNGMRVASGQVPYRDYFYADGPLTHLLPALAYLIAHPSVVAARWMQQLALVLAAWQTQRIARWLGVNPWLACLPALLVLSCFYPRVYGVNHHWMVLPFVLMTLLAGLRAGESPRLRSWALAGACAGLAFLCLQTDATIVMVALLAHALLGSWLGGERGLVPVKRAGAVLAGWMLPVGLAMAGLAAFGALGAAFYDLIIWPGQHVQSGGVTNDVRYLTDLTWEIPPLDDAHLGRPMWYLRLWVYLTTMLVPISVALVSLLWGLGLIGERLAGRLAGPETRRFGLVAITAIGFGIIAVQGRADVHHLGIDGTPAFLVLTALVARAIATTRGAWRPVTYLPVLGLALMIAGGIATSAPMWLFEPRYLRTLGGPDLRAREDAVLAYLHAHARPGDRMVALPAGPYYYYYGLPPAVRLSSIFARYTHFPSDALLDEFWQEVASGKARFLVVDPTAEPYMRDAFIGPPPGYHQVYTAPSFRYVGPPVRVYEFTRP